MSTVVGELLSAHPMPVSDVDRRALAECVEECMACAQACTVCGDACLAEPRVEDLRRCIRTNTDCADVCDTAARVLSRQTGFDVGLARVVLEACGAACGVCAEECEQHASAHAHCRLCGEACRRCEDACRALLTSLGPA